MDLLNNSGKRRIVVGLVSFIAALTAGLALVLNRFGIANDLFVSGVLIIFVEIIYTINRYLAKQWYSSSSAFNRFLRGSQAAGALFFWGLALVLLVRGIVTLAVSSGS
jgi:hypothetical protein